MNLNALPPLLALVQSRRVDPSLPDIERAVYENFGADERVSAHREKAYASILGKGTWGAMGEFAAAHGRYLRQRIWCSKAGADIPDTFDAALNGANFWPDIDDNVALYRLEPLSFALRNTGVDEAEFQRAVETYGASAPGLPVHDAARVLLQRVLDDWNRRRDRRPAFATTADEIRGLLAAGGADWSDALRDHLGLGYLSPTPGRVVAILLMRYTAAEVRASAKEGGVSGFCIPSVLDSDLSPYFFPTPIPGPGAVGSAQCVGRSVNLRPATRESDYLMGLELLHSFVKYKPQHMARWGVITRPPAVNLAELRSFHLSWLRLETERDDYGCDLGLI